MNRKEFMEELMDELDELSSEEKEEVKKFYNEILDSAGIYWEDEVSDDFANPKKIAKEILFDETIKYSSENKKSYENSETNIKTLEYMNKSKIILNLDAANLEVHKSNNEKISINYNFEKLHLDFVEGEGILKINASPFKKGENKYIGFRELIGLFKFKSKKDMESGKLIVMYIPDGLDFEMHSNASNVKLDNVNIKNFTLESNASNIKINEVDFNNIKAESNASNIKFYLNYKETFNISSNASNVKIELMDKEKIVFYKNTLGKVKIEGDITISNKGTNLFIDSNVSNIKVM